MKNGVCDLKNKKVNCSYCGLCFCRVKLYLRSPSNYKFTLVDCVLGTQRPPERGRGNAPVPFFDRRPVVIFL